MFINTFFRELHSNYSPFVTHQMFIQIYKCLYKNKKKQQVVREKCVRGFMIWFIQNKIICTIKSKCVRYLWLIVCVVYS